MKNWNVSVVLKRSLVIYLLVSVCLLLSFSPAGAVEIIVSENDELEYRYLKLDNDMQVLLISDPAAEKSAAALDVHIGSNQNPKNREGLAHFLEHMLFLGTKKYPDANDYQDFISRHGGSHNAYTSSENTNYHFDVDARYLESSLDRFAQFFIAPLFTKTYVERERHAVESEYKLKIKNEYRRRADVYRELMNPDYPLSQFATGNLQTLSDQVFSSEVDSNIEVNVEASVDEKLNDSLNEKLEEKDLIRDALLAFYYRYYSANQMSLVVLGRESLDDLETMVLPRFEKVKNNNVAVSVNRVPMYREGFLPARVLVQPLKEERLLTLSFPIPDSSKVYREKPLSYLGNLLGHEGKGSLLSFLKRYGWAEGLSAGGGNVTRGDGRFDINIHLTERGVAAVDQIVALVFHVIDQLEKKGVKAWRFEEDQKLAAIAFRFQEKTDAVSTVTTLAGNLHQYVAEDILRGRYQYETFDANLIETYLSYLRPDNMLLMLTAPKIMSGVKNVKISKWYQVPYAVLSQTKEKPFIVDKYSRQLYFPVENPFVPQRLKVKSASLLDDSEVSAQSIPEKIIDMPRYRVWYQQDVKFQVPRSDISLRLKLPLAAQSVKTAALNRLFVALVNDSINEFSYPASLAGLYFSVTANSRGIDVGINGYNDRQGLLLTRIIETMRRARFDEVRFERIKVELLRSWNNADKATPYQQLASEVAVVQFSPMWSFDQLNEALRPLTLEDFNEFHARLLDNAEADTLFYGNLYQQEAVKLASLIKHHLLTRDGDITLPPARVVDRSVARHGEGVTSLPQLRILPVDHKDTAVILYLQGLHDTLEDKAKMLLLRQVLRAPFYNSLRTEKQLGYVVMVTGMPLKKVPGTLFIVQSPVADGVRLIDEMSGFVEGFTEKMPDDLSSFQQAVRNNLLQDAKNLSEQSRYLWTDILYQYDAFDRRQRLASAVDAVTSEQLAQYYQSIISSGRRLWVLSSALDAKALVDFEVISNPVAAKQKSAVYTYP